MVSSYQWRVALKSGFTIKSDERFIYLVYRDKKQQLTNVSSLNLTLKTIGQSKFFIKLNEKLSPILKMLMGLGCIEFDLIDEKKKKMISIDFYPKMIAKKSPKKWEISEKCFLQKNKNAFILRSVHSGVEIKFFTLKAFEDEKETHSEFKNIVYHILNEHKCLKTEDEIGSWDFHDELFHEKTRSLNLYISKKVELVPKKKKGIIPLLKTKSLLPSRRSRRAHGKTPLLFKKISTLLKSVAEKKKKKHLFFGNHYEGIYPSAGGTYENEFYLLAGNCQKLKMGLYRYDGFKHELINLEIGEESSKEMLKMAGFRINQNETLPQAVIIVTSKLPLLQKKYSKVAYRLSLLNTGVITAYLDLLSNELELAGCPTGSTDWKAFEQVTGIDHLKETAMMEYVIGESEFFKRDKVDEEAKY